MATEQNTDTMEVKEQSIEEQSITNVNVEEQNVTNTTVEEQNVTNTTVEEQNGFDKTKNVIIFHKIYNEDLSSFFQTLKEMKKTINFKYYHGINYIFIKTQWENLTKMNEHIKFQISRYQTKSEYKCPNSIATKICEQLGTFVYIKHDKENEKIIFTSRLPSFEHTNNIITIFSNAQQKFFQNRYKLIPNETNNKNHNKISDDDNSPYKDALKKT